MDFLFESAPARVVFGAGRVTTLADEVARLGAERVLLICSPRGAARAERALSRGGIRPAASFRDARMHVPREIVGRAVEAARDGHADLSVAIGGGSTIGLAKALSLELGLPSIALPTTYSGSELTSVYGIREGGEKRTGRAEVVRPRAAIYDPELSEDLPLSIAGPSGLNAAAHAAEALYAPERNPVVDLIAEEALRVLVDALPALARRPRDGEPRTRALYGAFAASYALASTRMGLHHKLCHVLGGQRDLPHAETHALLLPYVIAFNAAAAPEAMQRLRRALGGDPAQVLYDMAQSLCSASSLADLGLTRGELPGAAAAAARAAYSNPRRASEDAILEILQRALEGAPPAA